jgi:hypothetical protein
MASILNDTRSAPDPFEPTEPAVPKWYSAPWVTPVGGILLCYDILNVMLLLWMGNSGYRIENWRFRRPVRRMERYERAQETYEAMVERERRTLGMLVRHELVESEMRRLGMT